MFQINQNPFGHLEAFTIRHESGQPSLTIVNGYGASILALTLCAPTGKSRQVILGYESAETVGVDKGSGFRGSLLFPFPNRLDNGKYSFEGKEYTFSQNETARQNALHGNLYHQPFEVVNQHATDSFGQVTIRRKASENRSDSYPFDVDVEVTFTLSSKEGLSVMAKLTNTGQGKAPVGFGYHPYYKPTGSLSNCTLELPHCQMYKLGDRMIPTGQTEPFTDYQSFKKLETKFDDGFKLDIHSGRQEIKLMDRDGGYTLVCWQGAGHDAFNYFQIYTTPTYDSIAIEPMSCAANAFQTGDGLKVLNPGECVEYSFGAYLS